MLIKRAISSGALTLLLLLDWLPATAQKMLPHRNRMEEGVNFYAAPNGNDANNSCRDPTAPCTPQGAHDQAKVDYDLVRGGCRINLAPGTYTVPAGGTLISGSGILAGHFSCEVSGPMGENGSCPNDQAAGR
jgi:hypothetical protein